METEKHKRKHRHKERNVEAHNKKVKEKRRHRHRNHEETNLEAFDSCLSHNQAIAGSNNLIKKEKKEVPFKDHSREENTEENDNIQNNFKDTQDHKRRKIKILRANTSVDKHMRKCSDSRDKSVKKLFVHSIDKETPSLKESLHKSKTFHFGECCQHRPRSLEHKEKPKEKERKSRSKSHKHDNENKLSEIWYCQIQTTDPFKDSVKRQECSESVRVRERKKDKHYVKERARSTPENKSYNDNRHAHIRNVTKHKTPRIKDHSKSTINVTSNQNNHVNSIDMEEMIEKKCSRTIDHNLKNYFNKIEKLIEQKLNDYLYQKTKLVKETIDESLKQKEKESSKHKSSSRKRERVKQRRNRSLSSESFQGDIKTRNHSMSPSKVYQRSSSKIADNPPASPSYTEEADLQRRIRDLLHRHSSDKQSKQKRKHKERSTSGMRELFCYEEKINATEEKQKNHNYERDSIRSDICKPEEKLKKERRLKSRHRSNRDDSVPLLTQPDPTSSNSYTKDRKYNELKLNDIKLPPRNDNNFLAKLAKHYKTKNMKLPVELTHLVEPTRDRMYIKDPSTSIVSFKPSLSNEKTPSLFIDDKKDTKFKCVSKQGQEDKLLCQRYSQLPDKCSKRKTNFIVEGIEPANRLNTTKKPTKNTSRNFECKTVSVITILPHQKSSKSIALEDECATLIDSSNKMKRLKMYYQCSLDSNKCLGSNFSEEQSFINESLKLLTDTSNNGVNETQLVKENETKVKDSSSILPHSERHDDIHTKLNGQYKNEVGYNFDESHRNFVENNSQKTHRIPSTSNRLCNHVQDIKKQYSRRRKKYLEHGLRSKSDIYLSYTKPEDNNNLQNTLPLEEKHNDAHRNFKPRREAAFLDLQDLKHVVETSVSNEKSPNNNKKILQYLENMYHLYLATVSQLNGDVEIKNLKMAGDQVSDVQRDATDWQQNIEKLVEIVDEPLIGDVVGKQVYPDGYSLKQQDNRNAPVVLENCKYKSIDTSYHDVVTENQVLENQKENLNKSTSYHIEQSNSSTLKTVVTTSDQVTSYHDFTSSEKEEPTSTNKDTSCHFIYHNSVSTSTKQTEEIVDKSFKPSETKLAIEPINSVKIGAAATKESKGKASKKDYASNITPEDLVAICDIKETVSSVMKDSPTNMSLTGNKELSNVCTIDIQTNEEVTESEYSRLEKKETGVQAISTSTREHSREHSLIKHKKSSTNGTSNNEEQPTAQKDLVEKTRKYRIAHYLNNPPNEAPQMTDVDPNLSEVKKKVHKLNDKPLNVTFTNSSQPKQESICSIEGKTEVRDSVKSSSNKQKENHSNLVPATKIPRKIKLYNTPNKSIKSTDNSEEYQLKKSQSEISLRKLNSDRQKVRTASLICIHRYSTLSDSSNSGIDNFYLRKSVAITPNITSRLLLTKDYRPPQMSSYQRRKIYDKNIRSKLKKKMQLHEKKAAQIFEVRYLTLGKSLEATNPKTLNKISENSTEKSVEKPVSGIVEETLRLMVKRNSEMLLNFIQENMEAVKRLDIVDVLRNLADSAESSKLKSTVTNESSKDVINFLIALNHCLMAFHNFETPEDSPTDVTRVVSSNNSTIKPDSETYTLSKKSDITQNCSCRTIEASNSSFDFLCQDEDTQHVQQKINFNPILGFALKQNTNIKRRETGSFVESYNSEESGYVSSVRSNNDPASFFKKPVVAALLRPHADLFENTSSSYKIGSGVDKIREDIASTTTGYYPCEDISDTCNFVKNTNLAKDEHYIQQMFNKDDSLRFGKLQPKNMTNRSKSFAYSQIDKKSYRDNMLGIDASNHLKLKKCVSDIQFRASTLKNEQFTTPKHAQSEILFQKHQQLINNCQHVDKCGDIFQSAQFSDFIESDSKEVTTVLKKLLDPGVYLTSTNFNTYTITLHIDSENQSNLNVNESNFDKNIPDQKKVYTKYDVSSCNYRSDVTKLMTKKFFENLLRVCKDETALGCKLFEDKTFLEDLFSVVSIIKREKRKGRFGRRMRFFIKNFFSSKRKVINGQLISSKNEEISPLDETYQRTFQILADYAIQHFAELVATFWFNLDKKDEHSVCGLLTLLQKIKNGHFTFIKVSKLTNIQEDIKNQLKQAFQNVYLIAHKEACSSNRKLKEKDMQLIGAFVCKYRTGLLSSTDLIASYLGKGLFETELELKAAVVYVMKVLCTIIELDNLNNFRKNILWNGK